MENIILVGFGGHAKSVADTIEQSGVFHIVGYTDMRPTNHNSNYKWLGSDEVLEKYYVLGIRYAFVSIGYMGNCDLRDKLYSVVKAIGYQLPVIIDKSAVIARDAEIGEGTYIGKGAIINAVSNIGKMCIINSGVLVEHESIIEDYCHVAVRATLCGNVHIGNHVFIGANATIIQGINVGEKSIVGAGSVVLSDVPNQKTIYGAYKTDR